MALNVVMLERGTRYPVPLPNENFLYHCSGVKFELKLGDGYPGNSNAHKSPSGTAFVSNQRIVFLPKTTTHENSTNTDAVNSFTIPHANLRDSKFVQPLFGANRFEAQTVPLTGGQGNIPPHAALILSFNEGGGFDFAGIARKIAERMSETGTIPPHEEELPGYDGPPPPPLSNSAPTSAPPSASAHPEDSAPGYPSDAPPGYEQWDSKS
ncbi:hypothetical protein GGH94_001248 [Coemansia aciculifera]|uniref:Uncharacterized protein n=2 Tax=Coemansia TaxID=4863 RepID=A0A9W8GPH4_9FUNG|nr:hypothetical protein GGI19_006415 [Coemansia pectinata]KAJ2866873.1 hypothetical protein GGH94_001248 [Coemansia aciculifera]KAJ2876027.1 hypothetical protein H4R27_006369 [Coemansia aciculifera]KAJ2876047.1 hypothetical protein GGH93_001075 [Coemansia aciculifera]